MRFTFLLRLLIISLIIKVTINGHGPFTRARQEFDPLTTTPEGIPKIDQPKLPPQVDLIALNVLQNKLRKNNNAIMCQNPSKTLTAMLLIILACGDIETNPGPNNSIYPCGICERRVNWSNRAIACDDCNLWFHQSCISMSASRYDNHVANESAIWICNGCNTANYCASFTYHSFMLGNSHNRFSLLDPDTHRSNEQESNSNDSIGPQQISHCTSPEAAFKFKPKVTSSPAEITHNIRSPNVTWSTNNSAQWDRSKSSNIQLQPPKNKENNLRILTVNAQSLRGKLSEFKAVLEYCMPDVVCLTESWLHGKKTGKNYEKDHLLDSELGLTNYKLFRNDRNEEGGGVLIMVHSSIVATEEPNYVTESEMIWVKLKLKDNKDVMVGCFYMPHRNKKDLEQLKESLKRVNANKYRQTILCGDFNCPGIDWEKCSLKHQAVDKEVQQELIDQTTQQGLHQLVREPTRYNAILDLVFTTNPTLVKSTNVIPGISDHDIVLSDFNIHPHYQQFRKKTILLYDKANWGKIKTLCAAVSREIVRNYEENDTATNMWQTLKTGMQNVIDEIPSKTVTNRNSVPWMTNELKKLIRKKARAHKKAKISGNWAKYKEIQKQVKKTFRSAEINYINNKIEDGLSNNNSKPLWRYIKSKRQDNIGISPLLEKGLLRTKDTEIAEVLVNQFSSVFTKTKSGLPTMNDTQIKDTIQNINIDKNGVEKLLRNIKVEKAPGPDDIPNKILKECAAELSPGITKIFQKSLDTAELPPDWTKANICPVFKKGDRHKAENYRPVSLTCVLSKILEHIICRNTLEHLEKNHILTNLNHGFRSGFSCETQLNITFNELVRNQDQNIQTDIAILDFSKAFDTVPHDRLLLKLKTYGIEGQLLKWIENFLCRRTMKVLVNGESSREVDVLSGVPQGTVLGPLLFLCHINDLPDSVTSQVRLFADDCLLYRPIRQPADHQRLQADLKGLEEWADKWGMRFNAGKCYILSVAPKRKSKFFYQLDNTILQEVADNPYLGLTISNDLTWENHINGICSKANSAVGFLRRNLRQCPSTTRRTAYISLVRPLLEYGATVWDPHRQRDIRKIDKVQRKAARFIENDHHTRERGCVTKMLRNHNLPSLQERRKHLRLTFMYKIIEGHLTAIPADLYFHPTNKRKIKARSYTDHNTTNLVSKYAKNNSRCFKLPPCTKPEGNYSKSFFVRTIIDWNALDEDTVNAGSVEAFKTLLHKN